MRKDDPFHSALDEITGYLSGEDYRLYQRAGVREYWIIDPVGKSVQVFRLEAGLYNAPDVYTGGEVPVGLWEDFSVDLSQVFGS